MHRCDKKNPSKNQTTPLLWSSGRWVFALGTWLYNPFPTPSLLPLPTNHGRFTALHNNQLSTYTSAATILMPVAANHLQNSEAWSLYFHKQRKIELLIYTLVSSFLLDIFLDIHAFSPLKSIPTRTENGEFTWWPHHLFHHSFPATKLALPLFTSVPRSHITRCLPESLTSPGGLSNILFLT